MKKTGVCPKCRSTKVGRFRRVADESDATTEVGRTRTLWWQSEGGWFNTTRHEAAVEAYVCTECGFFEEYVRAPRQVEWEKLDPFEWHDP